MADITAVQKRLLSSGFKLPKFGADGDFGKETQDAIYAALDELDRLRVPPAGAIEVSKPPAIEVITGKIIKLPAAWLPDAKITRIHLHWTAGHHQASDFDRLHYHVLVNGDGSPVRGIPTIDLNSLPKCKPGYAAHTLDANTGAIGVSLCCMANSQESPFKPGNAPMTKAQYDSMIQIVAQLCNRYGIKPGPKTVLSHAEVQATLGIKQKNKWDYTVLPFDLSVKGAKAIGDKIRAEIAAIM